MTTASRLRVGVIGAGSWAVASHIPNLLRRPEVAIVGVSRHGPLLPRIADRFGIPFASEDYRDVLELGLDVCVVATPTAFHYTHAKEALLAGAHVLCEKPFTIDPGEAWDLTATATAGARELTVAFGWNYKEQVIRAKEFLDAEGIGEIESIQVVMSSPTRQLLLGTGDYPDASEDSAPESSTWADPAISGGGYGQAQLSHALGAALYLSGERVVGGLALGSGPAGAPVDLHDGMVFRLEGGGIATVAGSSADLGVNGDRHLLLVRITGNHGQVEVDLGADRLVLYRTGVTEGAGNEPVRPGAGLYDCQGPVDYIVDYALGIGAVNRAPAELGARTVEALDVAYRSMASGRMTDRFPG